MKYCNLDVLVSCLATVVLLLMFSIDLSFISLTWIWC